jgi:hypothetical protein
MDMNEQNEWQRETARPQREQFKTATSTPEGVRVYERPARRSPTLVFVIVLLILALLAAMLFFQFIR